MTGTKQVAVIEFTTKTITGTITRPANTTTYAAGDVVAASGGDHFVFEKAVQCKGGSGEITAARITSSQNASTAMDAELWLFRTNIAEAGDNAAFAPTDTEMLTRIGIIDFATANWKIGNSGSAAAGNRACETVNLGIVFSGGATTTIYGVLVTRNAYVPVSGEVLTVDLMITQD